MLTRCFLSAAPLPDYGEIHEDQDIQRIDNFDNMGLKQELLRGIYSYGFEKPSTIQQKAIVPTLKCVLMRAFVVPCPRLDVISTARPP